MGGLSKARRDGLLRIGAAAAFARAALGSVFDLYCACSEEKF